MTFSSHALKSKALEMGFNLVGITRAEPSPRLDAYFRWVEAGMQGTMGYMTRPDRQARRHDLNVILPGVKSLVVIGLDYQTAAIPEAVLNDPSRGRIAAYAWGVDYHHILTPRLERLAKWILGNDPHPPSPSPSMRGGEKAQEGAYRVYVDTGAILERSHAHEAGLGFIGKNTMLIHPRRGSTFFLGEILTTMEFDSYDRPGRETLCGNCTRCLMACPTKAFPQPHVLDARRCISYLTIEHKGSIDPTLRHLMGNWVYGCDVCQDVCPFQRFALPTQEQAFYPADMDRVAPRLVDLLGLDEEGFQQRYSNSPIARIKRERLVRNACIAAGNWGSEEAIQPLKHLLNDASEMLREHAAWALDRIRAV